MKCSMSLGEMEKGKIRKGTILFCADCGHKADVAMKMAEIAQGNSKDFLSKETNDFLRRFGL